MMTLPFTEDASTIEHLHKAWNGNTNTGNASSSAWSSMKASAKEDSAVHGDPRYLKDGEEGPDAAFRFNATYTVAQHAAIGVRWSRIVGQFGSSVKVYSVA